jgi:hypothetical protein
MTVYQKELSLVMEFQMNYTTNFVAAKQVILEITNEFFDSNITVTKVFGDDSFVPLHNCNCFICDQ